jgi:hypothetical protein
MTSRHVERTHTDLPRLEEMSKIPIIVRIGVTGHRHLANETAVRESIQRVLEEFDESLRNTPHSYIVISPLAEGADRLVAQEVLSWHSTSNSSSQLEAPLPMPEDEYVKDFPNPKSKAEFKNLLARANRSQTLDLDRLKFGLDGGITEEERELRKVNRRRAYRNVGFWVVDNCDVLIAIWNGEKAKGEGGTGEVAEYAQSIARSIVWIHSETGEIRKDMYGTRLSKVLQHHDAYNAEKLNDSQLISELNRRLEKLKQHAEEAQLDTKVLEPFWKSLLAQFVRATTLAALYQRRYFRAGTWVYILAASSVATVTVATLFFEKQVLPLGIPGGKLIWLEVGQIVVVVLLLAISALGEWHRKWIDYRFLDLTGVFCTR